MTEFKPGQKVRITYEGVVQKDSFCADGEIAVKAVSPDSKCYHYHAQAAVTVALVEPAYADDAMYVDADGEFWHFCLDYLGNGPVWFSPGCSTGFAFARPVRPLRRLIPQADAG